MVVDIVSPHDMTWTSQHSPWRLWISTYENTKTIQDSDHKVSLWTYLPDVLGEKLNAIGLFCFCLCQNGGQSQLSYHPCFSANTVNNRTPCPPMIISLHRATHSCGKHAVSVTTASCVEELHPEPDGSQQAPLSQFLSLSVLLFLSTVWHILSKNTYSLFNSAISW